MTETLIRPEEAAGSAEQDLAEAFEQIVFRFRAIFQQHGPDSAERYAERDAYAEELKQAGLTQEIITKLTSQAHAEVL